MPVGTERTRERIWEGRLHLGDDPGIYGDASYAGLAVELPVTLALFPEVDPGEPDDINFEVAANRIRVIPPYRGHRVIILAYEGTADGAWSVRQVGEGRMDYHTVLIATTDTKGIRHFGVRLEVDKTVPPGLYDDFVLLSLSLRSLTHYASFGFRRT